MMNLVLLSFFLFFAFCLAFNLPHDLLNSLTPEQQREVRAVPEDLLANQLRWREYCSGYSILVDWALEQVDPQYISSLLNGPYPKLVVFVLKKYVSTGNHGKLALLLSHVTMNQEVLLKAVKIASEAASKEEKQDYITTLEILLNHDPALTTANIQEIDDIFSNSLCTSMSHFLLDYLMTNTLFPAVRLGRISRGWSEVIQRAIGQDNFLFLRRLLADWEAFKTRIDLSCVRHVLPHGAGIPVNCRSQFYIVQALETHFNENVIWLLVGRTTIFRTLADRSFMNSQYGQQLVELIPELKDVDWSGKSLATVMTKFIRSVYERRPESVAVQIAVLLSSTWKTPIETYIKLALQTCSLAKIRATMQAGKLKISHLPLIHMSTCTNMPMLDQEIDQYLGLFDPQNLHYKNDGPVIIYAHVLLQSGWRAHDHITNLLGIWHTMGNMAVLRAIDQIVRMILNDNKFIGSFPSEIGAAMRKDPASILDVQVAWDLLVHYYENGQNGLLMQALDRLPLVTKCKCLLISGGDSSIGRLLKTSIDSDKRLFEYLHNEQRGNIIPPFVLSLLSEDTLHELLLKAASFPQTTLLPMVLDRLGEDLSELVWIDAVCRASPSSFSVLLDLPIANRIDWIQYNSDAIEKYVLVPALLNDTSDVIYKILSIQCFPIMTTQLQQCLLTLAAERKWTTLGLFFDRIDYTRPLYLAFDGNALLEALLEANQKKLVKKLLKSHQVFRMALTKPPKHQWTLYQMFPELLDVTDIELAYESFKQ